MNTQPGITKYMRKFEAVRERPDKPIRDTNIQGDNSQRRTLEYGWLIFSEGENSCQREAITRGLGNSMHIGKKMC